MPSAKIQNVTLKKSHINTSHISQISNNNTNLGD